MTAILDQVRDLVSSLDDTPIQLPRRQDHKALIEKIRIAQQMQDSIVQVFIVEWLAAGEEQRAWLRYGVDTSDSSIRYLVDQNGIRMCEVDSQGKNYTVLWIRSLDDLEELDRIGQFSLRHGKGDDAA